MFVVRFSLFLASKFPKNSYEIPTNFLISSLSFWSSELRVRPRNKKTHFPSFLGLLTVDLDRNLAGYPMNQKQIGSGDLTRVKYWLAS